MGIVRTALRLCAVQAIRGATWADKRVHDSEIGPIDDELENLETNNSRPFISIYTDDSAGEIKNPAGNSLTMVFELGATSRTDTEEIDVPTTNAGLEFILDMMQRQLIQALRNPDNQWSQLWQSFFPAQDDVQVLRGANYKDNVRYAGRQIKITGRPLPEPGYGVAPTGKWVELLDAMKTVPELGMFEIVIRSSFGADDNWPDWKQIQDYYSLTNDDLGALKLVTEDNAGVTFSDLTQDTSTS